MKLKFLFLLATVISFTFISCGDDMSTDLVKEIQPTKDQISIDRDTFHMTTETVEVSNIISRPDSFLLGSFIDDIYGTTRADLITQLYYPVNYTYMDPAIAETVPDSVVVTINYTSTSFFGQSNSPMEFSVYELKTALNASTNYYSDLNPGDYADLSTKLGSCVETIDSASVDEKTELNTVRVKLSNEFMQRFFTNDESTFTSEAKFLEFFKGLYITTTFGNATLLNVNNVQLNLYCHYTYKSDNSKVKFTLNFPASSEIRSINRVLHPYRKSSLMTDQNYNYVCAPANYYTKIRIPIGRMREKVKVSANKQLVINSSILTVNAANKDTLGTSLPYISNLMLFKGTTDDLNTFFKNKDLPTDSTAFVASISSKATSSTTYKYYYTFSGLEDLIETELKNTNGPEYLDMLLVPVILKYSSTSSTTLSEVVPSYTMEAAAVYSGKNSRIPMKMEVVFSGF